MGVKRLRDKLWCQKHLQHLELALWDPADRAGCTPRAQCCKQLAHILRTQMNKWLCHLRWVASWTSRIYRNHVESFQRCQCSLLNMENKKKEIRQSTINQLLVCRLCSRTLGYLTTPSPQKKIFWAHCVTFQCKTSSDRLCRKGELTRSISRRQQRRLIISLLWYFRGNLGWLVVNALCFGRNSRDLRFQSLSLNGNNVNVLRRQKNYYDTWKYSRFTVCTFVGFFLIGFVRLLGLRVHINDVTFLAVTTPQLPASFAGLLPSPATHFWRKWLAAFTTMTIRALKIRKTVSSVTSNSNAFRWSILKLKTKVGKKYLNG